MGIGRVVLAFAIIEAAFLAFTPRQVLAESVSGLFSPALREVQGLCRCLHILSRHRQKLLRWRRRPL